MKNIYEVWNKPENGPLTVLERGPKGELAFLDEAQAINWAKDRKKTYPHMDWVVVKETSEGWSSKVAREKVFDTSI
jgi:hypothetical protein